VLLTIGPTICTQPSGCFLLINRWEHRDYQSCGLQLSPGPVTNIEGPFGVKNHRSNRVECTAALPQKAAEVVALPRSSALCQKLTHAPQQKLASADDNEGRPVRRMAIVTATVDQRIERRGPSARPVLASVSSSRKSPVISLTVASE
jgi:hypothetical protein